MKKFFLIIFFAVPIICMDNETGDMKRSVSVAFRAELVDIEGKVETMASDVAVIKKAVAKVVRRGTGAKQRHAMRKQLIILQKAVDFVVTNQTLLKADVGALKETMGRVDENVQSIRETQVDGFNDVQNGISAISDDKYQQKLSAIVSICIAISTQLLPYLLRIYQDYSAGE